MLNLCSVFVELDFSHSSTIKLHKICEMLCPAELIALETL